MRARFAVIFAASGAAALVYEVTWTRLLTLQFGHGVAAASTVLAAFMGGLAVGSAAAGRWGASVEPRRALRVYASLELAIAALALGLPSAIAALDPLLKWAYADGAGGAAFALLRLTTSLVLLSFPAAAMGATFPIAARWFIPQASRAARDAGVLYAANTTGAAIGALAAGFVLLPSLGLTGTTWVGVLLNLLAAGGAWWIATSTAGAPDVRETPAAAARHNRPSRDRRGARGGAGRPAARSAPAREVHPAQPVLAAIALGISGFASLTLQVVWTRVLALMFGPTTYAFSMMVAIFIAGLAIGAGVASRLVARAGPAAAGLAICLALSVGCGAAAAAFVDRGLLAVATIVATPGVSFGDVLLKQAFLALGLLAPMTIAFGAAFPYAVAVGTRTDDSLTTDLGLIYAVNTVGAIAGALLAGFVLIPWFGLHGTIRFVTVAGAAGAIAVSFAGRVTGRARLAAAAVSVAVLAAGVALPPWDRLLLSGGGYKYAPLMQSPDLKTALTAGELLYYEEGASGTVAVRKAGGTISLAIDGKVDASNAGDMLTQRLLAHVPLLLHPNPKRVAILGLGSGVTLGSALRHPIERADVLEISPQVAEASRFFEAENHGGPDDPRTRLIIGDGRTHLLLTREQYDVIVSEPSNPWMAGIASLFTREFFEAARRRLQPGGILCQWAHTYDISPNDLQSIVATFVSVFPDGTLWLIGDGDVLLVGSTQPIEPRLEQIGVAWRRPGVAEDLASVGALEPFHLLSLLVARGTTLAQWTAGATVQSDDRAALEFTGPRSIFGPSAGDNATDVRTLATRPDARPAAVQRATAAATSAALRDRGWMLFRAEAARPAYDDFVSAVEQNPADADALDGLVRASVPIKKVADARAVLRRVAADSTQVAARLALSRLLASEGAYDEAVQLPLGVLEADPANLAALEQLASVLADLGDAERLRPVVARMRAEAPSSEAAHYYSAALLFIENRPDLALVEARKAIAVNRSHAKAHNLIGACLASLGQRDEARAAFQASISANPRDPGTYANLATLELQSGNREQAARYFAEALSIDPNSEQARRGLAEVTR